MRGLGDPDVLITIRGHSDSEMGEQGFLDLPHFHGTLGSMTTDSPSESHGPYVLAGVPQETPAEIP